MKPILRKLAEPYFRIYFSYPVWFYLLNRKAKRTSKTLTPVYARIANDLKRDGIAITSLEELNFNIATFEHEVLKLQNSAEVKNNKKFLKYLWDAKPKPNPANPFHALAFSLNDIADEYFNLNTVLYYLTLNVTMPTVGAPSASQNWHRDPEDKKLCKMFLYITDVDETAGPFIYVKGSQYGGKWQHAFPRIPPHNSYPEGSKVDALIPKEDILICLGKKGTLIFADTTGLHKGGYATKKERVMFTAGFRSPASPWPPRLKVPVHNISFATKLLTLFKI